MAHLRAGREAAGPSPAHRDIFMIGVCTGMRLGEVVSLRWERVDLERRVLRVEETKAGEPLELPVTRQLAAVFERCRDRSGGKPAPVTPGQKRVILAAFEAGLTLAASAREFRLPRAQLDGVVVAAKQHRRYPVSRCDRSDAMKARQSEVELPKQFLDPDAVMPGDALQNARQHFRPDRIVQRNHFMVFAAFLRRDAQ